MFNLKKQEALNEFKKYIKEGLKLLNDKKYENIKSYVKADFKNYFRSLFETINNFENVASKQSKQYSMIALSGLDLNGRPRSFAISIQDFTDDLYKDILSKFEFNHKVKADVDVLNTSNCMIYGKDKNCNKFSGVSISNGEMRFTDKLIHCNMCADSPKVRNSLQNIANDYKDDKLIFQLRDRKTGKVLFQTK